MKEKKLTFVDELVLAFDNLVHPLDKLPAAASLVVLVVVCIECAPDCCRKCDPYQLLRDIEMKKGWKADLVVEMDDADVQEGAVEMEGMHGDDDRRR